MTGNVCVFRRAWCVCLCVCVTRMFVFRSEKMNKKRDICKWYIDRQGNLCVRVCERVREYVYACVCTLQVHKQICTPAYETDRPKTHKNRNTSAVSKANTHDNNFPRVFRALNIQNDFQTLHSQLFLYWTFFGDDKWRRFRWVCLYFVASFGERRLLASRYEWPVLTACWSV